jgi:hypothetical protein
MSRSKAFDPPIRLDLHLKPADSAGLVRPTWRYRLLLLAIGSVTPNGSDITASDRQILLGIDKHLARFAAAEGEEAAERALGSVIEVLETGGGDQLPN